MIGNKTAHTGDNGVAVVGDGNDVKIINSIPITNRSFLYDVCCTIADANIEETAEYSISTNSEWSAKMKYNKIKKYAALFDLHSYSYGDVEEILENFEKRTTLIRHIKGIYVVFLIEQEELSKDKILDLVFDELKRIVIECNVSSGNLLTEEQKSETIYQVMFYAFTKCQLLDPIPESERGNYAY
ncbi:hypothetical protein [Bacillus paranthracis]|uniref:hypothetical protein n=1 Tax=Bacillus paranthracis TaxID=2026186 RepID=UPI000D6AE9D8|nr:hypothetical protein [Bacillus paranthracis]PWN77143.1 hypothetical protein CV741_15650 [Bacillus cereus]PWN78396.1 hypothetical protein CV717_23310 [Bacillus cereus]QHH83324.1 hypothetical protein FPL02_05290 [Bacillus paranthracis]UHJ50053.1 hypothetical protein LU294_23680 [Bacillus paranthracis]